MILDSGNRTEFSTGAVRDMRETKGRCDLLPLEVVEVCLAFALPEEKRSIDVIENIRAFIETGSTAYLILALDNFEGFDDSWSTMFLEVARHFEEGAKKYGENNWRKGIPVWCYIDSALRHFFKWFRNDEDEPHDRAFCWNIMCAMWTCEHMPELNTYAKKEGAADE